MKYRKLLAVMFAAAMSVSALSGCSGNDSNDGEGIASESTSSSSSSTDGTKVSGNEVIEGISQALEENEMVTDTRPIEEGDDYAINKINNKTSGDVLPGGFTLQEYQEEAQGKMYTNEKSQIVIRAYNYKEDLQDMAVWADNACALLTIGNMTSQCDTIFEDPEDVKVCGFDCIKYDYQIVQNAFIPPEDDPDGEAVKTELYRFKARNYYFYSDQDAYIIMFNTLEDNWEEQLPLFEEFVADLEITPTEY